MPLTPGGRVELSIEKPAAGGRMIARHERQVVLVHNAIPGERVIARIERVERQLAFAEAVEIVDPSADRIPPAMELSCGGCLYAHVAYSRQLTLKSEVVQDAFARLGRIPLELLPAVTPSPDRGYRRRARLHVRGERVGFSREGTHELCDAEPTGQVADAALDSARRAVVSLVRSGCALTSVELSENIAGDERVLHLTAADGAKATDSDLDAAQQAGGLTGCTLDVRGSVRTAGLPVVSDPLATLTMGRAGSGTLQRHAESFFQANRHLLPQLVVSVMDHVPADGSVLDLYAGVGLFSISLASAGRERITAVEGDRSSARDLQHNAAQCSGAVRVWPGSVEEYLKRGKHTASTVVVDPPRTGISREAMAGVIACGAARVVYVSCDPATMARDARRLLDAGYRLESLRCFDLFPNTPHVESVGVFDRANGAA